MSLPTPATSSYILPHCLLHSGHAGLLTNLQSHHAGPVLKPVCNLLSHSQLRGAFPVPNLHPVTADHLTLHFLPHRNVLRLWPSQSVYAVILSVWSFWLVIGTQLIVFQQMIGLIC